MKLIIKELSVTNDLILPAIIKDKIDKYVFDIDKKRCKLGWSIILSEFLLSNTIDNFNVYYNCYNKPYIKQFYFNISHHDNIVAVIINDTECGIDISGSKNNTIIDISLFANYFTLNEFLLINNDQHLFHKYWSIKEAFIKFLGTGLNVNLQLVEINDNYVVYNNSKYKYSQFLYHDKYWVCYFS